MRNMIVVISDLHFEEEATDVIRDSAGKLNPIEFRRNVPSAAFEDMMRDVAEQARTNGVTKIDFVLAGDIFDLYRTQYWFLNDQGLRPYVDCKNVTLAHEEKLVSILEGIVNEAEVSRSVAVFRRFAAGRYLGEVGKDNSEQPFGIETELHYLPGNHDRLANATPTIRLRIRQLLGLQGGNEPFPHFLLFDDPPVLVRHGHEYDRYNFGADLTGQEIAAELPSALYDAPTWGDFNTVMVAARLPFLFRRRFNDMAILTDPVLQTIYCRLLEFDDVRPQSALIDFFLNTTVPATFVNQTAMAVAKPGDIFPHREVLQKMMWTTIKPIVRELLDEIANDPFASGWIRRFFPQWSPVFMMRLWRLPLPLWFVRWLGRRGRGGGDNPSEAFAAKEKVILEGSTCFVCAGHTHDPGVSHIMTRDDRKRYFTDTGTWRNAVLAANDKRSYGRVNTTTYVSFYGKEIAPGSEAMDHGFEFWTGYDQNWPVDGFDH